MSEILKPKKPDVCSIPDNHIFYIPGKLESRTGFGKMETWRKLKDQIDYEGVLRKFGFILEGGFNEAKFFLNDTTGELRYGNELDVAKSLENASFHVSGRTELRHFISVEVFKSLTSEEFHQSLYLKVVVPDNKIDRRKSYLNASQRKGIIDVFKKMKGYIIEYAVAYSNDKVEQKKNKFEKKKEVLHKSIDALSQLIATAESGHMKDFELLMLTRLLVYQMNKKS